MWPQVITTGLFIATVYARDPTPISLPASDKWLGIDGNWSTIELWVGPNQDVVNALVSTSISEFWAVGPGGCLAKESHCIDARGGIYHPENSANWKSLGSWDLGLEYLGYKSNGDYGLDSISNFLPINKLGWSMSNVLIASINSTDSFISQFGLGNTPGNFSNKALSPPLAQAVNPSGWTPSYSYGFTAGAHYNNSPISVTLGGSDTSRYEEHDTSFTLSEAEMIPRALVRAVTVATDTDSEPPEDWTSRGMVLSNFSNSFTAIIDSSTPYLWLPGDVCDEFADALNLTYNTTFDIYTLTKDQYRWYQDEGNMYFTFALSSFDNKDDFGQPLDMNGVVNITVDAQAFVGLLQYPFMDGAIKYGDPSVPYFMLKKANQNDTAILGRSFLQEAYLITKYDQAVFSVHQAKCPEDPVKDAKLVAIEQGSNSPYPAPKPPAKEGKGGLDTGEMVGIVVGAAVACVALVTVWWCCRRRRNKNTKKALSKIEDHKDSESSVASESPRTPVARILSKIAKRKRSRRTEITEVKQMAQEAPDGQIYELSAPLPPVELNADNDRDSMDETEFGTDNSNHMTAYEVAQRKIDRQLQGPVPEYSPPEDGSMPLPEKMISEINVPALPNQIPPAVLSPLTPRFTNGSESNSLPSVPSPISPRADWNSNSIDLPSPITLSVPARSASPDAGSRHGSLPVSSRSSSQGRSTTRSNSSSTAPASPSPVPLISQSSFQRTPIDPSKVVCLGPLPENIQAPRQSMVTRVTGAGRPPGKFNADSQPSEDSLGSNYTDDEDRIVQEMTRQASLSATRSNESRTSLPSSQGPRAQQLEPIQTQGTQSSANRSGDNSEPNSDDSQDRIDSGMDFIHVPQMAERRYSWEEER